MEKRVRAVFFDADGTLYDSNRLHYLAYKAAAKILYNFDLPWKTYNEGVLKASKKGVVVLREHGVPVENETFYELKDTLYTEFVKDNLAPMPGVLEFLAWCKSHTIRCFVISSSKLNPLRASLVSLRIDTLFENIIAMERSGSLQKPHHFPYELGLKLAKLRPEHAIAVEDTSEGITSAQTAGLWCAAIKHSTNRLASLEKADLIIKNYAELEDYLKRHERL